MAVCDLTGKKTSSGNLVSHSVRRTKRHFRANIQSKKMTIAGQTMKLNVSTNALRTLAKPSRKLRKLIKQK